MADIVFQRIVSTRTGTGASTGKETERAFNDNFDLVKTCLDQLFNIASSVILSDNITQIKADTSTTPYTLYYTVDPLDTDPSQVHWELVTNVTFADIQGLPSDNIALGTALDSKGSATDVATLQTQMSGALNTLSTHTNQIATNTQNIGINTSSINSIRTELQSSVVHNPAGSTLYLRLNNGALEYSTDGTTWISILATGIAYSQLTGNASDSSSLVNYVATQISTATSSLVSNTTFQAHTSDINNPHGVTKAQIGLGNVQNLAPADMPISTAVQNALNSIAAGTVPLIRMSPADYQALPDDPDPLAPDPAALYITNSTF